MILPYPYCLLILIQHCHKFRFDFRFLNTVLRSRTSTCEFPVVASFAVSGIVTRADIEEVEPSALTSSPPISFSCQTQTLSLSNIIRVKAWIAMMVSYLEVNNDILDNCADERVVEWYSTHFGRIHEAQYGGWDLRVSKRLGSAKEMPVDMRGNPIS